MKKLRYTLLIGMAVPCFASDPGSPLSLRPAEDTLRELTAGWNNPARTYKSHTRWWWPGNALTKEDITWQLEQMAQQGFGGVEIMSAWKMYEKGSHDFLTPEFMELVKHAVAEGKRLDIEVAITFSPGWSFGGPWVAKEDQSKALCFSSWDIEGGTRFSGALPGPDAVGKKKRDDGKIHSLVAVVAGRLVDEKQIDGKSLLVLTPIVNHETDTLGWDVPPGRWRLMAFWLKYTGQVCQGQNHVPPAMVIDHMDKGTVQRYCNYVGGAFQSAVGDEFGKTVDSFFCDSFEIKPGDNALLWSTGTLAGFKKHAGYDLTPYLPALWFDIGPLTPRIRYDLGSYLSDLGLDTVFKTMNDWCDAHHLQARIQPHYRFTSELVQAAGSTARPETELTTARFEPVADPRKATASGARFYGRDFVSAEAYTFIHPTRYITNLQDLKIATDAFLRDGITQFYNHGYFASPEKHVAPTRDVPFASRISHWNSWWPYYHCFADYVARSSYLLRQGKFMADVAIYSPQATAWSKRAIWGTHPRVMRYGNLARTLVANGYDFDIVNDDLLQNKTSIHDGIIEVSGYARRVLILPNATVVPIKTMRVIRDFVKAGGTVVALEALPEVAAGLDNYEANDREMMQIVESIFRSGSGGGVFLPEYKIDGKQISPRSKPYETTAPLTAAQRSLLAALNKVIAPDFALEGNAQSDGLTFIHRQIDNVDVYFVCNLQPDKIVSDVTFRVNGKIPQRWDAMTGKISPVPNFSEGKNGTVIPLDFEAWESAFFLFAPGTAPAKTPAKVTGTAVSLPVNGSWKMKLEGYGFDTFETELSALGSWTDSPRTCHFSGTGIYETGFVLPEEQLKKGTRLVLDLGTVGDIAEVVLNDQPVGVAWMSPYRLDITAAARAGTNRLVVKVTNTIANYVAGLKVTPEVPAELQARLGTADQKIYPRFRSTKLTEEMNKKELPVSGLIGPVTVKCMP